MIKGKITITKTRDYIHFYYVAENNRLYLFAYKFTKGLYIYFHNGKSIGELSKYKNWERNPRVDKTVTKIPIYIKYMMKECA